MVSKVDMSANFFVFQVVKDPHMFAASTIRRALDMQAPFLQCIKYFHTISCSTLQSKFSVTTFLVYINFFQSCFVALFIVPYTCGLCGWMARVVYFKSVAFWSSVSIKTWRSYSPEMQVCGYRIISRGRPEG